MDKAVGVETDPFRYMVRQLIAVNSPSLIRNDSPAHARILLEEMFANAKESAYVYCGRISDEVWGGEGLARAVREAISRKVEVRFIVQRPEEIPADSAVAAVLRESGGGTMRGLSRSLGIDSHFAVFDGKMFRFEKSDEKKTAIACVNGPETARKLRSLAQDMLSVA